MNETEIKQLIENVVSKQSNRYFAGYNFFNKVAEKYVEPEYPDYYSGYRMAIELAEANRVHIEKGYFPYRLFAFKSPHETDEELTYIRNNYKQTTLSTAIDYINTTQRAYNEGNYSIHYGKDDDQYVTAGLTLQHYLETGIETFGSLENYMKMFFLTIKAIDANGVIAIKNDFEYSVDGEGNKTVSTTALNEPQPIYYDCCKVVAFDEEKYCLIDLTKYEIPDGKKKKKQQTPVLYFELYDTVAVYHITYKVSDQTSTIEVYDKHDWGKLPVQKIKGIPRQVENEIIWQSPFSFASDLLDLVLIDESTINLSKKKCAFPTRVYVGRPCEFQYKDSEGMISSCSGGRVYDSVAKTTIACPNCNGSGLVDRFSPLHDFILNPGDGFQEGQKSNGFQYVSPDPRILEYLRMEISINEERAKKILHLQTSNSQIKGGENLTATGMTLDEKAMNAFVKPISDQVFDMQQFIIEAIAWLRYKRDVDVVTIIKPRTFDFKTEYDYINEISQGIKDGLPAIMVYEIVKRYLKSHFYTEDNISKAFNLFMATDLLLGIDNATIELENTKGIIANWQVILHNSGIPLIDQLQQAYKKTTNQDGTENNFFTQDFELQRQQLIDEAKRVANENKPVTASVKDIASSILGQ